MALPGADSGKRPPARTGGRLSFYYRAQPQPFQFTDEPEGGRGEEAGMSRSYTLGEGVAGGGPSRPGRVPGGEPPLAHSRQFLFYYGQSPGSRITMTQMSRCFAGIVVWAPLVCADCGEACRGRDGGRSPGAVPAAGSDGARCGLGCRMRRTRFCRLIGKPPRCSGRSRRSRPAWTRCATSGAVGGRGREARPSAHVAGAPGSGKRTQPEPGFRSRTGRGLPMPQISHLTTVGWLWHV